MGKGWDGKGKKGKDKEEKREKGNKRYLHIPPLARLRFIFVMEKSEIDRRSDKLRAGWS